MKKILVILFLIILTTESRAQVTSLAPGEYKSIIIPAYSPIGDYTRSLILLHEAYLGSLLNINYAIGTITALRGNAGSWHRVNIAEINSGSSYNDITASIVSFYNNAAPWKLKTCLFNGKKYLAVDVPYNNSFHGNGYMFAGWTISTAENMLAVPYQVNGQAVNQDVLSSIEDFTTNLTETRDVKLLNVLSRVNIGTETFDPDYKLQIKGKVRAQEIKVENTNWPDYVFSKSYRLPTLQETEKHIKNEGHLPGIPSAAEVRANGLDLGEMNAKLLEKIEELTLHLIEKDKELQKQNNRIKGQKDELESVKSHLLELTQIVMKMDVNTKSN